MQTPTPVQDDGVLGRSRNWGKLLGIVAVSVAIVFAVSTVVVVLVVKPAWERFTEPEPLTTDSVTLPLCHFDPDAGEVNVGFYYHGPVAVFTSRPPILVDVVFRDQTGTLQDQATLETPATVSAYASWTRTTVSVAADTTEISCEIVGTPRWAPTQ